MSVNLLKLLVIQLALEPLLSGVGGTSAVKSYRNKVAAIKRQAITQYDQVTGRAVRGRGKFELMASLEEDSIPTPPVIANNQYNTVLELVSSLEEDSVQVQNGNLMAKKSYRKNAKSFSRALNLLSAGLGAGGTTRRNRKTQVVLKPTT